MASVSESNVKFRLQVTQRYKSIGSQVNVGLRHQPRGAGRRSEDVPRFDFGFQDQLKWQRWHLTLGGRHDPLSSVFDSAGLEFDRDDTKFIGGAGLGYGPISTLRPM
jgi:hypothetical protein